MRTVILVVLLALSGCGAAIDYSEHRSFDACRDQCESYLPGIFLPSCALREFEQFNAAAVRIHNAVEAIPIPPYSCGCLIAKVSDTGYLEDIQIVFATSMEAVHKVALQVSTIPVFQDLTECAAGTKFPVTFPVISRTASDPLNRAHTVFPIQQYVQSTGMTPSSTIQLSESLGWSYLNNQFGIIYVDAKRYLVEMVNSCGAMNVTSPEINGLGEQGNLAIGSGVINGCAIGSFYTIGSDEEELMLKMLANMYHPNPEAAQRDQ